jgi:ABC-type nitrate/sulfonate/bicarbonate transport system substrate-binding protein
MITRRKFLSATTTAALAVPGMFSALALAQVVESKTVKVGSILAGTTVAGNLMQQYLKETGVSADILSFGNITQRMQAVASGDVQIGYGGINAAIAMAARGFPLVLLANACDGGFAMIGRGPYTKLQDLKGKKIAVQFGSLGYVALQRKLEQLGMIGQVEQLDMNMQDMPVALQRGDIDAMHATEPYPTLARLNGWGTQIWLPYDTPMGRTNVGLVASLAFVTKYPILTRAVVKAHVRATRELAKDNTLAVDTVVKTLNVPRAVAQESMKNTFFSADSGPAFHQSVMAMGDMMIEAKLDDKVPNWQTFFRTDMVV